MKSNHPLKGWFFVLHVLRILSSLTI
ncbi:hypothetical protein [Enterococcus ratti]